MTSDFRNPLDHMIDLRHPRALLSNRIPWQEIGASLDQCLAPQVKTGIKIKDLALMELLLAMISSGIANACRLRLPTRLMLRSTRCWIRVSRATTLTCY